MLLLSQGGARRMSGAYDTPGTMQFIVAAPSASAPVRTTRFSDGYTVEVFIRAADPDLTAWAPSAGASIGLDIAIDVSGTPYRTSSGCTSGQRGQYFMRVSPASDGCNYEPYCDDRAFCSAQLI